MDLEGKTLVVTGASGGIGQAVVRAVIGEGARVVLHAFGHHERLADLKSEFGDAVRLMLTADFRLPAEVGGMFAVIKGECQYIDGLINVAGVEHTSEDPFDADDWMDVFGVNVFGVVESVRHALPMMNKGVIVNISSVAGATRTAFASESLSYAASKAALDKVTDQLALMVAPAHRVVGIAPGYVLTPMWAHFSERERAECERDVPIQRFISPDEVGAAVVFAFKNDGFTGTTLTLDAGLGVHHIR